MKGRAHNNMSDMTWAWHSSYYTGRRLPYYTGRRLPARLPRTLWRSPLPPPPPTHTRPPQPLRRRPALQASGLPAIGGAHCCPFPMRPAQPSQQQGRGRARTRTHGAHLERAERVLVEEDGAGRDHAVDGLRGEGIGQALIGQAPFTCCASAAAAAAAGASAELALCGRAFTVGRTALRPCREGGRNVRVRAARSCGRVGACARRQPV